MIGILGASRYEAILEGQLERSTVSTRYGDVPVLTGTVGNRHEIRIIAPYPVDCAQNPWDSLRLPGWKELAGDGSSFLKDVLDLQRVSFFLLG